MTQNAQGSFSSSLANSQNKENGGQGRAAPGGLQLQLIFFAEPGNLIFHALGNHDDIQALLKSL